MCFAHSGRTDSNGGHYDNTKGEYHYHHGYLAHQHNEDGSCPYEIDENDTKQSSSFDKYYKEWNTNNSINKVVENINVNDLKLQIQAKQSTIEKLNNETDKREKEIQNLKNGRISMWIVFIFLLILSIYLSYKKGLNKKVNENQASN